jgi:replicative DNA helicase
MAMPNYQERPLPQNIDAETALLGCIMMDQEIVPHLYWLTPDMFYRAGHQDIYQAMQTLYRHMLETVGTGLDFVTLCDELERTGKLDQIGGYAYISSLVTHVPTSANFAHYAEIVRRTYVGRQAVRAAGEIAALAYEELDAEDLRRRSMQLLTDALWTATRKQARMTRDVGMQMFLETQAVIAGEPNPLIPTGFRDIDAHIAGGKPAELIIIAGRPGSGKSSLGLDIAKHMAAHERDQARASSDTYTPGTVLYVTMEMRAESQVERLVSQVGNLNSHQIRTGFMQKNGEVDTASFERFNAAVDAVIQSYDPILQWYDDILNVTELEDLATQMVAEDNLKVLVIDQLDLFASTERTRRETEYDRVSEAVQALKTIARRLNILVICLCQLNREAAGVRPKMKHLRMSGRIEQDADVVLMLYRPAEDDPQASDDAHYPAYTECWLAKVRSGQRAGIMIPLMWTGALTTFNDWPVEWPTSQIVADLTRSSGQAFSPTNGNGNGNGKADLKSTGKRGHSPLRSPWADADDDTTEDS